MNNKIDKLINQLNPNMIQCIICNKYFKRKSLKIYSIWSISSKHLNLCKKCYPIWMNERKECKII